MDDAVPCSGVDLLHSGLYFNSFAKKHDAVKITWGWTGLNWIGMDWTGQGWPAWIWIELNAGRLRANLGCAGNLSGCQIKCDAPGTINPVCYTRDATEWLVQLDVLCIVAGEQQEFASTTSASTTSTIIPCHTTIHKTLPPYHMILPYPATVE